MTEYAADTQIAEQGSPEEFLATVENPKLRALLGSLPSPEAYNWHGLFPKLSGVGASGDVKRRVVMLKGLADRLDFLLFPGEKIEFVTKGVLNSFLEQYFMGVWAFIINRTLFVFTNYRVILAHCDGKGRAKSVMWQIPYARLKKYGSGLYLGSTTFRTDDGKAYKFVGIPRADRKRLRDYVNAQVARAAAGEQPFPSHAGRDPLCPACASPCLPRARGCEECGEAFIDPRVPALMSLVIPGLGDLYLGHRSMAAVEFCGFAIVLLVAIAMLTQAQAPSDIPAGILLVVIANTIDGAMTYHIARKALLPKRLAWKG